MSNEFDELIKSSDKNKINELWKQKLTQQDNIAKRFYDLCNFVIDKYTVNTPIKFKVFLSIVTTVQKLNPHYSIKITGPFFWRFKDQILEGEVDWIYDYGFTEQMVLWKDMINKFPTIMSKKLDCIVEEVRDHIKKLSKEVPKEKGSALCQHFLKWYSSYNELQKEIEELSDRYSQL
jgi:uncharacterized protein YdcH (DUF465 family)